MSRRIWLASISILIILILTLACAIGNGLSKNNSADEGADLVKEAMEVVLSDFVDSNSLTTNELAEGAIRGMVEALNDPYTSYLTAEQYQLSLSQLEGEFGGIGAIITIKDKQLTVVAPIAGSPAEKAGLKAGDIIEEVNGNSVSGISLQEAQIKIRGREGTMVKLLVLHLDADEATEIEITRAVIELPSVSFEMLPDNIAHISISDFTDRTVSELTPVLKEAIVEGVVGIILDLRNNPGGIVDAAVGVTSQFIGEGIILYALDNEGKRIEWSAQPKGLCLDIPLAVLVNGSSASASEVVSGALQDYGRGPIIGVRTFGKGSMNHVHQLSNGGALYITFARWFTPHGNQIDGKGIIPDIEVEMTPEDTENGLDPQLDRAVEYLKGEQ